MHLIIKNKYLKKIKNFLINIIYSIKNRYLFISVKKDSIIFYFQTDLSNIKFELLKDEDLIIKKIGEVYIDIKTLETIIEYLKKNNDLEIYKAEKNYLQFFSGNFNCDLVLVDIDGQNVNDFIFEIKEDKKILIDYLTLKNSYNRLKDFCKNSENLITKNTVLSNIHFYKQKEIPILEVWASDSYRTVFGEFDYKYDSEFKLNLSPVIMNSILGFLNEYSDESIEFYLNEEIVIVKKNEYLMKIKVDISEYPEFIKWFNLNPNLTFSVDRKELLDAIDRTSIFLDKLSKTTLYRVNENNLYIEYKDSEKGSCKEVVEINTTTYNNFEVFINSNLLKYLIKAINSETVIFKIHDSLKPIVILPYDSIENFKQFIVPAGRI